MDQQKSKRIECKNGTLVIPFHEDGFQRNMLNFKKKIGFNIPTWTPGQIPYLATGAVIPPNREFMAVLGDQKHGNNIEAPESLLRKIVREEAKGNQSGGGNYRFTANLNRRVIFDEIIEEAKLRQTVSGRNPFEMA